MEANVHPEKPENSVQVDLQKVKKELESGSAVLIDVREQDEWNTDHLRHSQLIPLTKLDEEGVPSHLPHDKTIYTHCKRGGRAQTAAAMLKEKYENVTALKYPFEELKKAGL